MNHLCSDTIKLIKLLKKISGVEMYQEICDSTLHGLSVANPSDLDKIFERLEIKPIVYWNPINNQQKQYIIVSNHPTGPLEGIFIQKIFNTLGLRGKTMGDVRLKICRDCEIDVEILELLVAG